MGLKGKLGIILLVIALLFFFPGTANAVTVSDVSQQLICQCGCNMVLLNCSHTECDSRGAMTGFIKQKMGQGQSQEEIIQVFVAQYGEQVLASPPKRGFNLMAWLTPFTAILFGGAAIYLAMKKWVGLGRASQNYALAEDDEKNEQYRLRLEKELEEFAEGSFR